MVDLSKTIHDDLAYLMKFRLQVIMRKIPIIVHFNFSLANIIIDIEIHAAKNLFGERWLKTQGKIKCSIIKISILPET